VSVQPTPQHQFQELTGSEKVRLRCRWRRVDTDEGLVRGVVRNDTLTAGLDNKLGSSYVEAASGNGTVVEVLIDNQ